MSNPERIALLRFGIASGKEVSDRVLLLHQRATDTSVRLIQLAALVLGGIIAVVGLLVSADLAIPMPAVPLLASSVVAVVAAVGMLIASFIELPGDQMMNLGVPPGKNRNAIINRHAAEEALLDSNLIELSHQVTHNSAVVAERLRRRYLGVAFLAISVVLFLAALAYILAAHFWL